MFILRALLEPLQQEFNKSQRATWFSYILLAIILPITASRASNLLRCLTTLFKVHISKRRFYIFMASPKIPWEKLWVSIWKLIPSPTTDGRLLLAGDDSINPKTGKKIFGCHHFFDHAAKANQGKYPWSQNIVKLGLLKMIHGRWACLPLTWCFYRLQKDIQTGFKTKIEQLVEMVVRVATFFKGPLLVITDSWFANESLFKPLRKQLKNRVHLLSRLRVNTNLYEELRPIKKPGRGRPRKYGKKRGTAKTFAQQLKYKAKYYSVFLYGKVREVQAVERTFVLKTLKVPVKIVWIYYRNQWIALFTTDLSLTTEQIITYYGARWKIESGFKEIKQELGSKQCQARTEQAVTNHLNFCMMTVTLIWLYCERLPIPPKRQHAINGREHFAFSDIRFSIAQAAARNDFNRILNKSGKPAKNNLIKTFLKLAA